MRRLYFFIACLFTASISYGQSTFPVNGTHDRNHTVYAFKNATIHLADGTEIINGAMLVQDGLIISIGPKVSAPAGAVEYDLKGKHIYPSFIDAYSNFGMPEIQKPKGAFPGPQMESNVKGAFGWNQAVRSDVEAAKLFSYDNKAAEELRNIGFGTVNSLNKDGIFRGSSVVVTTGNEQENISIVKDKAASCLSFDKGTSTQDYPSSLTGAIALIRQTFYDLEWYKNLKEKKEFNITLEALNSLSALPQIIEVNDKLSAFRADRIGDEFKVNFIIKGSGDEYQRIKEIAEGKNSFIIPLNFPAAFDVEDPYDASLVSLEDMKHWEMAALNPAALFKNGVRFSITASDLKDKKEFWKNLRKAILHGLPEKEALRALTMTPATLLGISDKVGDLRQGMIANFLITSSNLFDDKNVIYENWVRGKQNLINNSSIVDIRGTYNLTTGTNKYSLKITGEVQKPKVNVSLDTMKSGGSISFTGNLVTLSFTKPGSEGVVRLSGNITESPMSWQGRGQLENGEWVDWKAERTEEFKSEINKDSVKANVPQLGDVIYPFTAYGKPEEKEKLIDKVKNRYDAVLIKNVTVWTNESDGILKNKDVYITEGKIVRIDENITPTKGAFAKVIDGTNKHLTAGIIDEHSHIALSGGVNEGTQASSAEVRMEDVINSEDINIYRQLAGGVTTAQLLHGSANPVGGQSAIIKLRWGKSPDQMKYSRTDLYAKSSPFIKFALGENVKQANWGDFNTVRFPQTRMGVEQVYYDLFTRAKEYKLQMEGFTKLSSKDRMKASAPRRDLELDALVEILDKKRFITCHSYVQSEINMLIHVADSMGFFVNTFTHILEGYKVADKMKNHGAGGSSFSDWWAYKMEVKDAIPHNGAMMHSQGVTVAFNSDDAEMARRLNQEAAKAVKYGGVSEEEALKFVTLNPAKLLHIEDKVGSIKVGKIADVVLWSDHPLSIYAKPEKTLIEGEIYFDIEEDAKLRDEMNKERARLIQKMIAEKQSGAPTRKPVKKQQKLYHCETLETE